MSLKLWEPLSILIKYKTEVTSNVVNIFIDSTFRLTYSHHVNNIWGYMCFVFHI